MSLLSPRLQLRVAQKQILTPGLVQMVTVLQLNRLELKEMISQEISENPVLEETAEQGDELTPEEVQQLLERERLSDPADQSIMDALNASVVNGGVEIDTAEAVAIPEAAAIPGESLAAEALAGESLSSEVVEPKSEAD